MSCIKCERITYGDHLESGDPGKKTNIFFCSFYEDFFMFIWLCLGSEYVKEFSEMMIHVIFEKVLGLPESFVL